MSDLDLPVSMRRFKVSDYRFQTSKLVVQGSGFRDQGSRFEVRGSRFRVQNSGSRVQGSGFRVQGSGFRVRGSGFGVRGSGIGAICRLGCCGGPHLPFPFAVDDHLCVRPENADRHRLSAAPGADSCHPHHCTQPQVARTKLNAPLLTGALGEVLSVL